VHASMKQNLSRAITCYIQYTLERSWSPLWMNKNFCWKRRPLVVESIVANAMAIDHLLRNWPFNMSTGLKI
jgi:hypothetical protein